MIEKIHIAHAQHIMLEWKDLADLEDTWYAAILWVLSLLPITPYAMCLHYYIDS